MELVPAPEELCRPDLRLTVDTDPDLALIRAIYGALQTPPMMIKLTDVVNYLDQNPTLLDLNSHIVQKTI
jgi:spore coat polysaccharide biosynthesis protein SpsF (cytidylyltransferase family)